MPRRTRLFLSSLLLLAVLLGVPAWLTWRAVRQEKLGRALITAIKKDDVNAVVSLLKLGADANARDESHKNISLWRLLWDQFRGKYNTSSAAPTALLTALEPTDVSNPPFPSENVPLIQALLDAGANVNAQGKDGDTALSMAFQDGYEGAARLLIARGADVNVPATGGKTLLMEAAGWGSPDEIDLLLRAGARMEARDSDGNTALLYALDHGLVENVRALVKRHADVNVRDSGGKTALSEAKESLSQRMVTSFNHSSSEEERKADWGEIVHLLKQAGAKE